MVTTIGGIVTALGSAVAYIGAEARVDAAAVEKERSDGNE